MASKRKHQSEGGEDLNSFFSGTPQTLTSFSSSSSSKRSRGREKGKEKEEEANDPKTCGICLMEEGRAVRGQIDCCDHYFCFVCIMEWAKKESLCPMCKQRFTSVRRPPKDGVFARERIVHIPIRDQVYHPLRSLSSGPSNRYAHAGCSECQSSEDELHLLCCDLCNSAAHTYCVGLAVSVPKRDWYCHDCTILRNEYAENEVSSSTGANNPRLSSSMLHGIKTLQSRCYLSSFLDKMNELRPRLAAPHYEVIDKLPFAHFFYLSETITGEMELVNRIVGCYDERHNAFNIGGRRVKFTVEEMCLILGLKSHGKVVSFDRQDSMTRDRYLKGCKLERVHILAAVEVAMRQNDVDGVVRLLVLYLFVCFLFPTTGGRIPPGLCWYVDNLERIGEYAWGEAVYRWLFLEVPIKARAIQAHNSGQVVNLGYQKGCTQALQVWLKEHSAPAWRRCNLGASPRFLKWEMNGRDLKKFLKLDRQQVSELPLKPQFMEQWLLNPYKSRPSNWLASIKLKIDTGVAPPVAPNKKRETRNEEETIEGRKSSRESEKQERNEDGDLGIELLRAQYEVMAAQLRVKDIEIRLLREENENLKEAVQKAKKMRTENNQTLCRNP